MSVRGDETRADVRVVARIAFHALLGTLDKNGIVDFADFLLIAVSLGNRTGPWEEEEKQ